MVQLNVLNGKMAGTTTVARRFPFRIGRAATADFRLEADGIWEDHLALDFAPAEGLVLRVQPQALAAVNGKTVGQTILRNGDVIGIGSLKIQFWLSPVRQRSLRPREALTWVALFLLCAGQVLLIYWLLESR